MLMSLFDTSVEVMRLRVYGEPKGQPRPRAFARKFGDTYSARVYDAGTAEGWKGCIALAVKPLLPAQRIAAPVWVEANFLFARPKCLCRKKDPDGRIPHTAKPDRDNCEKALLDALTQVGLLGDDKQVCDGAIRKFYVAKGERPGCEISVRLLEYPAITPGASMAMAGLFATGGAR